MCDLRGERRALQGGVNGAGADPQCAFIITERSDTSLENEMSIDNRWCTCSLHLLPLGALRCLTIELRLIMSLIINCNNSSNNAAAAVPGAWQGFARCLNCAG